jgi:hypothetical protein
MRDAFIREGMATKAAKTKAAKIYNSNHTHTAVTGQRNEPGSRDNRDNRDSRDNRGGRQ